MSHCLGITKPDDILEKFESEVKNCKILGLLKPSPDGPN